MGEGAKDRSSMNLLLRTPSHPLSLLVHFHPLIRKLMLNSHLLIFEIVVRNVSTDVERQYSVPRPREWTES